MPKLNIRRFDASKIRNTATVMIIGKRGSGKSTILTDIMYHKRRDLNFGLYVCPTEDSHEQMGAIIPSACMYTQFHDSIITRTLNHQQRTKKRGRSKKVFLITDDCMYDPKTLKGVGVREAFMNGRHRDVFVVNVVQYMMDIPSALRGQIDYVFATRDNIVSQREKLWKYFFGMFANYSDFSAVMDQCTEGYNCIVIDNTVRSNNAEDCVFWYSANPDPPPFRMCDDIYWKLNDIYYVDRDDEDADDIMPGSFTVTRV